MMNIPLLTMKNVNNPVPPQNHAVVLIVEFQERKAVYGPFVTEDVAQVWLNSSNLRCKDDYVSDETLPLCSPC